MAPATTPPLWSLPKAQRPPHGSLFHGVLFAIAFNTGILVTNLLQLLAYPLSLFPFSKPAYASIIRFTKGAFGRLTVLISQRFAPTRFVVSAGEGMGEDEEDWVERDERGRVVGIKLPDRGVWMANHQTLSDWLYLWSFAYLTRHHSSIFITLKSSLKWIPVVGWACQIFGFIFLSRSWATDKGPFKDQLDVVGEDVEGTEGRRLALLFFPEGTLVTGNTRPLSAAYALKTGVPDLSHTLLPRSTGLFFALRTLSPSLPTLSLIDLTIGYPGPRAPYWPEDYYDLTLWFKNVPPPSIHIHVRKWDVGTQVPLGDLSMGGEGTEEEKKVFDEWLQKRWREKDGLMERFVREGGFVEEGEKKGRGKVEWRVELRSWWEALGAFSFFAPVAMMWLAGPVFGVSLLGHAWRMMVGGGGGGREVVEKAGCGCAKMAAASAAAAMKGEL